MSNEALKNKHNLAYWLDYIQSIDPNKMEFGLSRIKKVASSMGLDNFKDSLVIEVAGTNGKGSSCALLADAFIKSGKKVGMYISPHILNFNERIVVNSKAVDDELLASAFYNIYQAKADINLTYFEFTTLAALYVFKHCKCEVLILEIGLGGRLDAVNIIDANISLISSIGLDHVHILGNSLDKIAYEKAGIIKDNCTVITGKLKDKAKEQILKAAIEHKAKYFFEDEHFSVDFANNQAIYQEPNLKLTLPLPKIPKVCLGAVIKAILYVNEHYFKINFEKLDSCVKNASMPCRMQLILNNPDIYLDVAHNEDAALNLVQNLPKKNPNAKRIALIAMLKDKDIQRVIEIIKPYFDKFYIASTTGPRGASYERIYQVLKSLNTNDESIVYNNDIATAFTKAKAKARSNDQIIVFGSFVTVGCVLEVLNMKLGV